MIKITNLSRYYGDFKAVDDVSFSIQPGEVVGLLGHNGAGKTTIMKMLTGFLEPSAGSIAVDQWVIGQDTPAIQTKLGYLPENCPLWPEMTVIDYLTYQANLHGIKPKQQIAAVARAIQRTALTEKATQSIQTLSRGYRQRVGVAQAILHDPAIIILDEPTNGLDPTQINQMRALIRTLAQSATVILSTHILQEVQAVCERVLIMRSGKLVLDSRLDTLQQTQQLVVCLNNPKAASYLKKIQGVKAIQAPQTDNGRYHYTLDTSIDTAPQIANAVQQAGDQLFCLQPQIRNLESVFAEVNSGNKEGANG